MGKELERLQEWHFALMSLLLAGRSQAEAAVALGRTQSSVSLVANSPQFQHELAKRRALADATVARVSGMEAKDARDILAENAGLAAQKLVTLMVEGEDEKTQLSAANSLLDRVYGRNVQQGPVTVIQAENMNVLVQALSESGRLRLAGSLDEALHPGAGPGMDVAKRLGSGTAPEQRRSSGTADVPVTEPSRGGV